jgi:hypothetical protein
MSWILWILIGFVGIVIYVNMGHLAVWTSIRFDWGNGPWWTVVWMLPNPSIFGIRGVIFSDLSALGFDWGAYYKDEKKRFSLSMHWIWPLVVLVLWIFSLVDWILVLLRTLVRGVKAFPKTRLFNIVFKGGWLK